MSDELFLTLPFPPSMNTYWRHIAIKGRPRTLISSKGRDYRKTVLGLVCFNGTPAMLGRLAVTLDLYPPDRRKRDVDNFAKSLIDAMVSANIMEDDSQIDQLVITRREVRKGGEVVVRIREMPQAA